MNDTLIRTSFHSQRLRRYHRSKSTLVLDEFGLHHGRTRADIVVINGHISGFEIKSDDDSLNRLDEQVRAYSAVFDYATAVTGVKHQKGALSKIPDYWGVVVCHEVDGCIKFETVRPATENNEVSALSVAQLLWKAEAVKILLALGAAAKICRHPRAVLYSQLAEALSLDELKTRVRRQLKLRTNWRCH